MACLISSGITRSCGFNFGGLQMVLVANASEVVSISGDADNQIVGITMATGATFYEFEFEPETGQFLEELQSGNVSKFILQTINLQLANITQSKRNVLNELVLADMNIIVQGQNETYWYAGQFGRGLKAVTGTKDSGTADADDNGFTLSAAGGNAGYGNTVDSTIIAGLL